MIHLDMAGQVLVDRYKVHEKIGEGAMGSVYRAADLQLEREVALKVLRREWVERQEVRQRLEHECRLMARLGPHANIVTLFDRLEHDGSVVLVMEFVPGETLASVLERTAAQEAPASARKTTPFLSGVSTITLSASEALSLACQCLDGLDFAHGRGVVHRDIKPSNILIMRDHNGVLRAKIMDFGIGKAVQGADERQELTALTRLGGPGPGTPAYMAPEQIDPERFGSIGPQADIYAMGITLYEMLTLRLPFGGTYSELMHAHTNEAPPDPKTLGVDLPQGVKAALRRSLLKPLAERYESAEEFRADLAAASMPGGTMVGGLPGYRPKRGKPEHRPQAVKKRRMLLAVALVGVVLVVMAVAGAVLVTGSPDAEPPSPSAEVGPAPPVSEPPAAAAQQTAQAARGGAESARVEAQAAMAEAGTGAGDAVAIFAQGEAALAQGEAAYGSEDWGSARDRYEEARSSFVGANQAAVVASRQRREVLLAAREAERAEQDARQRYEAVGADVGANESFTSARRAYQEGDAALHEGNYAVAKRHFSMAVSAYAGVVAPRPAASVTSLDSGSQSGGSSGGGGTAQGGGSSGSGTGAGGGNPVAPAPAKPQPKESNLKSQFDAARAAADAARNTVKDLNHAGAAEGSQAYSRGRRAAADGNYGQAIQEMNTARDAYNRAQ